MATKICNPKCHLFWIAIFYFFQLNMQIANSQTISLEDIWIKNTFSMKMEDDYQFSKLANTYFKITQNETTNQSELAEFDILTNKKKQTKCVLSDLKIDNKILEIDDYFWSENELKLLIQTQTESIYRRSTKAIFYVYDLPTKKIMAVADSQKITQCALSPDANKVAFTKDNNLYIKDLTTKKTTQITFTGKQNEIIHGTADWVYEEEFETVKYFFWNNESNKLAFLSFDESQVNMYNMQVWGTDLYPTDYTYKYPKAGQQNAKVSVSVYDLEKNKIKLLFDGTNKDAYIPRLQWTNEKNILSVRHLNRNQDSLAIVHYATQKDSFNVVLSLKSNTYIDIDDNFYYLKNSNKLLYKSNDNFRNIKLLDLKTKQLQTPTATKNNNIYNNCEIQNIVAIDEKNQKFYYTAKDNPPFNQHLFSINFDGKNKTKLTTIAGVNAANIDFNCTNFMLTNSTIESGLAYSLHHCKDGSKIKDLEKNVDFRKKIIENKFAKPKFHTFSYTDSSSKSTSSYGATDYAKIKLYYYLLKPSNFDSTKKHPVVVYFYGGPGSQEVINEWQGKNYLWFQHLLSKGFVVACCDNRGTGGRGIDFQHCTTKNLGQLETQDQIAFGKHLQTFFYVDAANLATFGWSYGGYLSTLCILKGSTVYNAAIAVAPVTSWRFYDTIYTERYLKNPTDNTKGYDDNSPLNFTNQLQGKLLLVHGTADDNVHYQNTIAMQQALQNAGKHFETYTYPDKAHGISGNKTRLHLYQKMTNFLEKSIKK